MGPITKTERVLFWIKLGLIQIRYGLVIATGFPVYALLLLICSYWFGFSTPIFVYIILSIPLAPLAFFITYVLGIKRHPLTYLLNSTKDGDFGAEWWLKREKLQPGKLSALRWWFRNPAWNFNEWFNNTNFEAAFITDVLTIKNTIPKPTNPRELSKHVFYWANKESGHFGTNHLYFRVKGVVFGRFSSRTLKREFMAGAGGNRYEFRFKL